MRPTGGASPIYVYIILFTWVTRQIVEHFVFYALQITWKIQHYCYSVIQEEFK